MTIGSRRLVETYPSLPVSLSGGAGKPQEGWCVPSAIWAETGVAHLCSNTQTRFRGGNPSRAKSNLLDSPKPVRRFSMAKRVETCISQAMQREINPDEKRQGVPKIEADMIPFMFAFCSCLLSARPPTCTYQIHPFRRSINVPASQLLGFWLTPTPDAKERQQDPT